MDRRKSEAIIEVCLEAVFEQYVLPLTLALGTLTATACRDRRMAEEISVALRQQAASCPPDVAGRTLLEALAALASEPVPSDPAAAAAALRKSLRLIQGGKREPE
jgi:hypothetical protein